MICLSPEVIKQVEGNGQPKTAMSRFRFNTVFTRVLRVTSGQLKTLKAKQWTVHATLHPKKS